jgi:taurine dioxygenase
LVIFFRGQGLALDKYMTFARAMGEPVEYPFVKGLPDYPQVIEVKKLEHEKANFGGVWHRTRPTSNSRPCGSMLLAREIPPYGGDTLFANQYLAYESLSAGMKGLLDGRMAVNTSAKADVSKSARIVARTARAARQRATRPSTRSCARIRRRAGRPCT